MLLQSVLLALAAAVCVRLLYLLVVIRRSSRDKAGLIATKRKGPAKTMIVMGSGGHTAEMLQIVEGLDFTKYTPRQYVIAAADKTSVVKVIDVEVRREPDLAKQDYEIVAITRSRHVQQSYFCSVFTTLTAISNSIPVVVRSRPDLILTNGPGTCVPICLVAFLTKLFFYNRNCKIVFVESFCRVRSLSLSGKILLWITDLFVVQWPGLVKGSGDGRKVEYFGRLSR
ncbi:UDP-N-acetylglucosamine transferase subunit ALG14 homolog [Toxorhynchites rutilus septentrionalis]|uniref:UDP-N-acetylglucosamine transferase subunit ALG14 homolog n=1 Tax=Toxorhynchites rutilus septentrionalis TaxID=329112 RepID=UPI00247AD8C9|nr:UDP-N-acetylglucosamine transferase subunit ALG14 homolog [Toxorhynchites rutilus septentrionalis]